MKKVCFKCGGTFPLEGFYRNPRMADGHLGKCKDCTKAAVRANRAAKVDHYREYDRARGSRPLEVVWLCVIDHKGVHLAHL